MQENNEMDIKFYSLEDVADIFGVNYQTEYCEVHQMMNEKNEGVSK